MRIKIVAVGNKMPNWISEAFFEYAKRMPPEANIDLTEVKPEKRGMRANSEILQAEAKRINAVIPPRTYRIVLDERGNSLSTSDLALRLKRWLEDGIDLVFIIGGADGLHEDIKASAQFTLALSQLTLPHGLARVILVEQLYRASTILNNHPYHRD